MGKEQELLQAVKSGDLMTTQKLLSKLKSRTSKSGSDRIRVLLQTFPQEVLDFTSDHVFPAVLISKSMKVKFTTASQT